MEKFQTAFTDVMNKGRKKLTVGPNNTDTNGSVDNIQYKLSAVVTHQGNKSTEVGHYVADAFR